MAFERNRNSIGPTTASSGGLTAANNLSDVDSASTSRTNLGLGTAATHATEDFVLSGTSPVCIFDIITPVSSVTTTETSLASNALTGVSASNGKVRASYGGSFITSATATRQIKVKYTRGAVDYTIFDSGALTLSLSSDWTLEVLVISNGADIWYSVQLLTEGAALSAYTSVGTTSASGEDVATLSVTGTAAGVGAASGDIVLKMGTGMSIPGA